MIVRWLCSPRRPLALAALSLLPGCSTYEKPKFEVDDRRLLVVPFRDLSVRYGHGYGESNRGKKVVEAMRNYAERNFDPNFTDASSSDLVLRELQEWSKEKITTRDWKNLMAGVDADLVLIGEIRELRNRDPRTIGIYKGTLEGGYTVIDARSGRALYSSTSIKVEYPPPKKIELPLTEFGSEGEDIEKGLLKHFGEKVGKELFGYYADGE